MSYRAFNCLLLLIALRVPRFVPIRRPRRRRYVSLSSMLSTVKNS